MWCNKAVEMLGDKAMVIAMEELSELQQAISKGIRGKLDKDNLAEEIADVMIILEWVKHKYDVTHGDIDRWLEFKRDRIIKRVQNDVLN